MEKYITVEMLFQDKVEDAVIWEDYNIELYTKQFFTHINFSHIKSLNSGWRESIVGNSIVCTCLYTDDLDSVTITRP